MTHRRISGPLLSDSQRVSIFAGIECNIFYPNIYIHKFNNLILTLSRRLLLNYRGEKLFYKILFNQSIVFTIKIQLYLN